MIWQDVHEIKLGSDWQDALNNAVSNCEVFVPLVTQRYGETLWTNREVFSNITLTVIDVDIVITHLAQSVQLSCTKLIDESHVPVQSLF